MKKTTLIYLVCTGVIVLFISVFVFVINNKGDNHPVKQSDSPEDLEKDAQFTISSEPPSETMENEYYIIYVEELEQAFISKTLNPDYSESEGSKVVMILDDDGRPQDDGMTIYVKKGMIDEKSKEEVKRIVGEDRYKDALKEIQDEIIDFEG